MLRQHMTRHLIKPPLSAGTPGKDRHYGKN